MLNEAISSNTENASSLSTTLRSGKTIGTTSSNDSTTPNDTTNAAFGNSIPRNNSNILGAESIGPKPLVAVSPDKSVFLSSLAADTTNEDVIHYINSNLHSDLKDKKFHVTKFNFNYSREKSSFRV